MLLSEMSPSRGRIIREFLIWEAFIGLVSLLISLFYFKKHLWKYEISMEYDVSLLSFLWNCALFKINALSFMP